MKRNLIILLVAVAGVAVIIVPLLVAGPAPERNVSLGGIIPEMIDVNRNTELATFALG